MSKQLMRSYLMYLAVMVCVVTILLNYVYVPVLSKFCINYFNLFSAAVIIIIISRLTGITNKEDFKLLANKVINVSNSILVLLAVEFIISLGFPYFNGVTDRTFVYSICLTPCFGFILAKPILRLEKVEYRLEKLLKEQS